MWKRSHNLANRSRGRPGPIERRGVHSIEHHPLRLQEHSQRPRLPAPDRRKRCGGPPAAHQIGPEGGAALAVRDEHELERRRRRPPDREGVGGRRRGEDMAGVPHLDGGAQAGCADGGGLRGERRGGGVAGEDLRLLLQHLFEEPTRVRRCRATSSAASAAFLVVFLAVVVVAGGAGVVLGGLGRAHI